MFDPVEANKARACVLRRKHLPGEHVAKGHNTYSNAPSSSAAAAITPNTSTCSNLTAIKTQSFAQHSGSSRMRAAWTRVPQPAASSALPSLVSRHPCPPPRYPAAREALPFNAFSVISKSIMALLLYFRFQARAVHPKHYVCHENS